MNASIQESCDSRNRLLPLEGGCNFRDIGGYPAQDGHLVRWSRVYRAGVLTYLTHDDLSSLKDLGVRAICDLRRTAEREHEPTHWHGDDDRPSQLYWQDGSGMPTIRAFAATHPATAPGMFDAMIDLYRALPAWMGDRIGGLFECVARGNVPLIVHCAAGKDRTGIAIAVLLKALGVPRDTIVEDYLLTNDAGNFEEFILSRHDTQLGLTDIHHPLLAMPQGVRRVLFSAEAAFLHAALDQIDNAHGGLDAYLERMAGVTPATRERVCDALLEPGRTATPAA